MKEGSFLSGKKAYHNDFKLVVVQRYSPILDMLNGEINSYNISEHPVLEYVMDMLDKAFKQISDNTNLIFYSG